MGSFLKTYIGNSPSTGPGGTTRLVLDFTATAGQTSFPADYVVGYVDVYQDGNKLGLDDFVATDGVNVELVTGAPVGALVEIVTYTTLNLAVAVASISGGTTGLTPLVPTSGDVVLDGVLNVAHGGTGADNAADALNNLGGVTTGKAIAMSIVFG